MRILLVEDDDRIADALEEELGDRNHVVEVAADGQLGWELMQAFEFDLMLLDVMLPKLNGIELCRRLRAAGNTTPILMLTGRDAVEDRVLGLDAGADDYLIKPFHLQELSARIRALVRRGASALPPVLEWEALRLDPGTCEVTYRGEAIALSPKEYGLLEFFLRHPRRLFSRGQLLEQLWGLEDMPEEATVKAHIRGMRKKLKEAGVPEVIETVYGLGYRLREAEALAEPALARAS